MSIFAVDKDGNRKQIAGVGLPGPAGKSAYQYAVEGGFAGTEAEFRSLIGMHSNPNLLDNWYFPSPINQRGQTEYTGEGYTIDRWRVLHHSGSGYPSNVTLTLNTDGSIELINDSNYIGVFQQVLENIPKGIYTASVLADESLRGGSYIRVSKAPTGYEIGKKIDGSETPKLYSATGETDGTVYINISLGANAHMKLRAMKLELGSVQTMAHQDASGNWVLNDPPPNPALELAKCQRYQMVYNCPESGYGHIAYVMKSQEGIWYGFLHLPNSLRSRPSIRVTGGEPILNIFNAIHNVSDWGVLSLTGNHALIYVSSPTDVPKGTWAMLQTTNSPAQLILDSNL